MPALTVEQLLTWLEGTYPNGEQPDRIKAQFAKLSGHGMSRADAREIERNLDQAILLHALKSGARGLD